MVAIRGKIVSKPLRKSDHKKEKKPLKNCFIKLQICVISIRDPVLVNIIIDFAEHGIDRVPKIQHVWHQYLLP